MLRSHVRDQPREFLLPCGGNRWAPRWREGIARRLRRCRYAALPGAHPSGHAALNQNAQSAGIGLQQLAALDEVAPERFVTLPPELRLAGRQIHDGG